MLLREVDQKSDIGAESRTDLNALTKYFSSFRAAILTTTWYKVLQTIDYRSTVLQARECTIDVEMRNLQSLSDNLSELRNNRGEIYHEVSLVAREMNILPILKVNRDITRELRGGSDAEMQSNAVSHFKERVFLRIIDNIIDEINRRLQSLNDINNKFSFLWQYPNLSEMELSKHAASFA